MPNRSTTLSLFTLIMLITGAIDSVRNLPATALFGSSLIFFFIFSALIFLIPTALVSAELSSTWSNDKGGIYQWVRLAFGEKWAFLAIWLQWINTVVWFPTILSFLAGTATFLIDPQLGSNKIYLITVILSVFWLLTILNLRGLHISARVASFCATIGMILPLALIILLAIIWLILGKPIQLDMSLTNAFPSFKHSENWISLTAIMAGFLGIELATVHVKQVDNPQKNFPKAILFSVVIILITMLFGSLAIALILPHDQISLVEGVMQAFTNFFAAYHMPWMIPVITIMMLIGSFGQTINWVISPVKGLLQAAHDDYLPTFLKHENKYQTPSTLLIIQAILVSIICLAFLLMPSVNGSYWFLTALSTQLYILMYVLMFLAALRLHYKFPKQHSLFNIPGNTLGKWLICLLGLAGCAITLIVGFFPPEGINVGSVARYEILFTIGMIIMILPVFLFYHYQKKMYRLN